MAPNPLLFISHSSGDTAAASDLRTGLLEEFAVFLDAYDLRAGNNWQKSIETALVKCDCAVIMLSANVKARPDWVAAEAFALALRQRELDPSLLIVPLLLPGFTAQDLSAGPFGPAKLNTLQGLSVDPAAFDLQPLRDALTPVRENYHARLPLQAVTLSLGSVIENLGESSREIIAKSLALDKGQLTNAVNPSQWLAAKLLRSDPRRL